MKEVQNECKDLHRGIEDHLRIGRRGTPLAHRRPMGRDRWRLGCADVGELRRGGGSRFAGLVRRSSDSADSAALVMKRVGAPI